MSNPRESSNPQPPAATEGDIPPAATTNVSATTGLTPEQEKWVGEQSDAAFADAQLLHKAFYDAIFGGGIVDGDSDDESSAEDEEEAEVAAALEKKAKKMRLAAAAEDDDLDEALLDEATLTQRRAERAAAEKALAAGDDDSDAASLVAKSEDGEDADRPRSDGEDEEEAIDWDRLTEDEDEELAAEREELGEIDQDFAAWLQEPTDFDDDEEAPEEADKPADLGVDFVEHVLHEHMVSARDSAIAHDPLPERLRLLADAERRVNLGPRTLSQGELVRISRDVESLWIVRQLLQPGRALAESNLQRSDDEQRAQAVARAVQEVLHLVLDKHLEPSHIFLYHRTALAPLQSELNRLPSTRREWTELPSSELAYSSLSGRRQEPLDLSWITPTMPYCGPSPIANRPIELAARDANWAQDGEPGARAIRKPGQIELGRLVWEILELDGQCNGYEALRQSAIKRLSNVCMKRPEFEIVRSGLETTLFENPLHAQCWSRYVAFVDTRFANVEEGTAHELEAAQQSPTMKMLRGGQRRVLAEFAADATSFQAFLAGTISRVPHPPQKVESPEEWAARHLADLAVPVTARTMADLIARAQDATVEQYAFLPELNQRVFQAFCEHGSCVVTPLMGGTEQALPVAELLAEGPRAYLELLDAEADGKVRMTLTVPPTALETALDETTFVSAALQGLATASSRARMQQWGGVMRKVMAQLRRRVVAYVRPFVRGALKAAAEQHAVQRAVTSLGSFCAEGPYQPTKLVTEAFSQDLNLWDEGLNGMEALPFESDLARDPMSTGHRRVCAVYRSENNVTVFALINEAGTLVGHTRWTDTATETAEGLLKHQQQVSTLRVLIRQHSPEVLAVGTTGQLAIRTRAVVREFIQQEVYPHIGVSIPVIYTPVVVARVAAEAVALTRDLPSADATLRIATALAQHVQHPAFAIARLFDVNRTALRLPLGAAALGRSGINKDRMYRWLQWEMSLWVSAAGVGINEHLVAASPEMVLQFVAGLGPRKSQVLVDMVHRDYGGRVADRETLRKILLVLNNNNDAVYSNAAPALRVTLTGSDIVSPHYCPLDVTLIPPQWYAATYNILRLRMPHSPNQFTALAELALMTPAQRFGVLFGVELAGWTSAGAADEGARRHRAMCAHMAIDYRLAGAHEVETIMDELVCMGEATIFRPFRALSAQRFFRLMTGVPYVANERPLVGAGSSAVYQGDVMDGVIDRVLVRDTGKSALVVMTSCGCRGIMFEEDITNDVVKERFQTVCRSQMAHREKARAAREAGLPPLPPLEIDEPSLRRGAFVSGTVVGAAYAACELRLKWADARSSHAAANAVLGIGASSTGSESHALGSQSSLKSTDLERAARGTALNGTRHPLFRDWDKARIEEALLQRDNVQIGEMIVRRASAREKRFDFCVVFKISDSALATLPVSERRDQLTSKFQYLTEDRRFGRVSTLTFADFDHCRAAYVRPFCEYILGLRADDKFQLTETEAREFLDTEVAENPTKLCAALVEVPADASHRSMYNILFAAREKGRYYTMRIAIAHDGYWLETKPNARDGKERWQHCASVPAMWTRFKRIVAPKQEPSRARSAASRSQVGSRASRAASSRVSEHSGVDV